MLGDNRSEFDQDAIVEKVRGIQIDESMGTFGDMIVQAFDSYTGEKTPDGMLVTVSVVGFNEGHPVFIGLMKNGVDRDEAIQEAMDWTAERCRKYTFEQMLEGLFDNDDN